MFGMGSWELVIIFLVVLLVFGAKRIPEMAQGLGKGIREFRKAVHDVQDEIDVNKAGPSATSRLNAAEQPVDAKASAGSAGSKEPEETQAPAPPTSA